MRKLAISCVSNIKSTPKYSSLLLPCFVRVELFFCLRHTEPHSTKTFDPMRNSRQHSSSTLPKRSIFPLFYLPDSVWVQLMRAVPNNEIHHLQSWSWLTVPDFYLNIVWYKFKKGGTSCLQKKTLLGFNLGLVASKPENGTHIVPPSGNHQEGGTRLSQEINIMSWGEPSGRSQEIILTYKSHCSFISLFRASSSEIPRASKAYRNTSKVNPEFQQCWKNIHIECLRLWSTTILRSLVCDQFGRYA